MAQKLPQIETAKIITISTEHLHPDTINFLDDNQGDMAEGPSIAVRNEGFLVNSHLATEDALTQDCEPEFLPPLYDRFPDLVLIRALARGLEAQWINIDADGVVYSDILPSYDDRGGVTLPTAEGWSEALSTVTKTARGVEMVMPSREVLEMIEAGQTPQVSPVNTPGM